MAPIMLNRRNLFVAAAATAASYLVPSFTIGDAFATANATQFSNIEINWIQIGDRISFGERDGKGNAIWYGCVGGYWYQATDSHR